MKQSCYEGSAVATPNRLVGESGAPVSIEDFDVTRGNKGDIGAPFEGQGLLEQPPGT